MKLQELLDGYSQSVIWLDNDCGYVRLAELCEGRVLALISEGIMPECVPGQRLTLIVVPDNTLFAPPESWWQKMMRKLAQWREQW